MICLLVFQGASAIDMYFSASDGSGTVRIAESYNVEEGIGVSSSASASFDSEFRIAEENCLWGSGNADINQEFYGSGGGADYVINYALKTIGASEIDGWGSACLEPSEGRVSRSTSTAGSAETTAEICGSQNRNSACLGSYAQVGGIFTSQSIATGHSVAASQDAIGEGSYVAAYIQVADAEVNVVNTFTSVVKGSLATEQQAYAGGGASAGQRSRAEGLDGYAGSYAWDGDWNVAGTTTSVSEGSLATEQGASAGGGASAGQGSRVDGAYGFVDSYAEDADRNRVQIHADFYEGSLETEQGAETGDSAEGYQITRIDGVAAWAVVEANNPAKVYYALVSNNVEGSAYLDFEGSASVTGDEAWAGQRSRAEGGLILLYAISKNKFKDRQETGVFTSSSWAWTSAYDDDAEIVNL